MAYNAGDLTGQLQLVYHTLQKITLLIQPGVLQPSPLEQLSPPETPLSARNKIEQLSDPKIPLLGSVVVSSDEDMEVDQDPLLG